MQVISTELFNIKEITDTVSDVCRPFAYGAGPSYWPWVRYLGLYRTSPAETVLHVPYKSELIIYKVLTKNDDEQFKSNLKHF